MTKVVVTAVAGFLCGVAATYAAAWLRLDRGR